MSVRAKITAAAKRRRQIEIATARACPKAFARYVFELELAAVHEQWLDTWLHHPQSVTHSGVGLGKSTLVRIFLLWLLGNDDTEQVIWIGATQKQPRMNLAAIKTLMQA